MVAVTYLVLNTFFVSIAWLVLGRIRVYRSRRHVVIALAHMVLMTAVFDSLIIAADIVRYDPSKLLGLFVGFAPIEDFAYTVVAVLFVPLLWGMCAPKKGGSHVGKS